MSVLSQILWLNMESGLDPPPEYSAGKQNHVSLQERQAETLLAPISICKWNNPEELFAASITWKYSGQLSPAAQDCKISTAMQPDPYSHQLHGLERQLTA